MAYQLLNLRDGKALEENQRAIVKFGYDLLDADGKKVVKAWHYISSNHI